MSSARELQFPLPLASAVEQLYISGSSMGYGKDDDAGLVRLFLPSTPDAVMANSSHIQLEQENLPTVTTPAKISEIGFIGLGAMGYGMATSLLREGYSVRGFDVHCPAIDRFLSSKGKAERAKSAADAVRGAEIVFLMVQNAAQVDSLLFGTNGAAECLSQDAIIILSSTVPPSYVKELDKRLNRLRKDINLIDAPVSGGVARAANGTLTVSDLVSNAIWSPIHIICVDHLLRARMRNQPSKRTVDGHDWCLRKFVPCARWHRRSLICQAHQPTSSGNPYCVRR